MLLILGAFPQKALSQVGNPAFTCAPNLEVPPTVRAEGLAENTGDFVLTCTGGTPTPAGTPVPTQNIQIFLNTNLTNRFDISNLNDVLLIIDEPHSAANPNIPLLACGAAGTGDNGSGQCPISGDGIGRALYNGSTGHPNVFQGLANGVGSVVFLNVPIDSSGAGTRTLRFKNIRANVAQIASGSPNQVTAMISINGSQQILVSLPQQTVALWQPGLTVSSSSAATLSPCGSATPQSGAQYSFTLREGFASAFQPKNIAQALTNAPSAGQFGPVQYPADLNQNIALFPYRTETGFFNGGFDPNPGGIVPALPSTPQFPAVRSLNLAGSSDQGTRLYVNFSSVPSGMTLYVPVTIPLLSSETANLNRQTGIAVLVATDPNGGGAFAQVAGNAQGLAALSSTNGSAMGVYEVLYADPSFRETITIPVTAAYAAGALSSVTSAQLIMMQAGFAPYSANGAPADSTVPVPRFSASPANQPAFLFRACSQPDLTLAMINAGTFAPAGTGSFTLTAQNAGDSPTSGIVTVTENLNSAFTGTALSGSGWSCNLASLSCTRSDALVAGGSYPPVTLTVAVAANASGTVATSAAVSGGGETLTFNDSAANTINITPVQTITVGTNLAGLKFEVDGRSFTSPQTFPWSTGTTHRISADATQTLLGTSYVFTRWSDSGGESHTVTVGSAAATYTATFGSAATTISCVATAGVPPFIRAEGRTEEVGDLALNCTGGTPTAAGAPVAQVDIHLTLNTNITSRMTAIGILEALLLIDQPHANVVGGTATLLACGAAGSNDNGSGVCPATGDGTGRNTYNGATGHANVFQGQPGGPNEIVWRGVPLDAPGPANVRVLQFTNVRGNASQLPLGSALNPAQLVANLSITPGGVAVNNANATVAFLMPAIAPIRSNPVATLNQCTSANPGLATDPTQPLDTGAQNGAQFSLTIAEGFSSSLRVKNYAQFQANQNTPNAAQYPADVNQDIPYFAYNTETGFFNGAATDPVLLGLSPGSTPQFPSIRGLNAAGRADSGTRVYLKFSQMPAGMQLFLPATVPLSPLTVQTGVAVLTATDLNGLGPYSPITGNSAGLVPFIAINGSALAVYEVVSANPLVVESVKIAVAAAYLAHQPAAGQINVEYGLAPLNPSMVSDSASPIPRFAALNQTTPAFVIQACIQPSLTLGLTHAPASFKQGTTGSLQITVSNSGSVPTSGTVTVTDTLPTGLTATSVSGSGWSCTVSPATCLRSDTLAPGQSFPAISIQAAVSTQAAASLLNSAALSGGASANAVATDTIGVSINPILDPATFVNQQYLDLLGRPSDPGGAQFWINQLNVGSISRSQLAYQFFSSAEFQQNGQLVTSAYIAVLGRDPDFSGWQFWVNGLHQGVPPLAVINSFVQSPEFQTSYGSLDNTGFVNRVYLNVLGRTPDAAGFIFWLGQLNGGLSRAQMMYGFATSGEFQANIRNRSFVILMYLGFLRRSPDPNGVSFWVAGLNQGLAPIQVVNSFIISAEYLGRFQ